MVLLTSFLLVLQSPFTKNYCQSDFSAQLSFHLNKFGSNYLLNDKTCLHHNKVPQDASTCSYMLAQIQKDQYESNKLTYTYDQMYKCFTDFGIETEYLKCNLKYDMYHTFRNDNSELQQIKYIKRHGTSISD